MKYLLVSFMFAILQLCATESFEDLRYYSKIAIAAIEFDLIDYDVNHDSVEYHVGYLRGKKAVFERILRVEDSESSEQPYSESWDDYYYSFTGSGIN